MMSRRTFSAPIGVSARHVHLLDDHIQRLFGRPLEQDFPLTQPGEFAARERVTVVTAKAAIHGVRVLGPARGRTQVELAMTDCFTLGITPTVRLSGNLDGTPGAVLVGPRGSVTLAEGVIVPARHLHIPLMEANRYGLTANQKISVRVKGVRSIVFNEVIVRSSASAALEMHLDTDEANAAGVVTGETATVTVPDLQPASLQTRRYYCVEDVMDVIRTGGQLPDNAARRMTAAAAELARGRGLLKE